MSTLKVNTLEEATTGGATFFTAKAFVNFDQTSMTIRSSGNLSSLTDLDVGDTRLNFSTALADVGFAASASAAKHDNSDDGNMKVQCGGYNQGTSRPNTTTSTDIVVGFSSGSDRKDSGVTMVQVIR
jgi:hypothetical protein